eukprot:1145510-Pelagomonas_calceolata.AAC.2
MGGGMHHQRCSSGTPHSSLSLAHLHVIASVHVIDTVGATYQVAAGHLADESDPQGHPGRLLALLQCGTSMLEAVSCMQFPEAVGMMEVRMGLHMGPLFTGVLGIKLPRYCLFGTTQVSKGVGFEIVWVGKGKVRKPGTGPRRHARERKWSTGGGSRC